MNGLLMGPKGRGHTVTQGQTSLQDVVLRIPSQGSQALMEVVSRVLRSLGEEQG